MTPHSPQLSENEIPSKRVVILIIDGVREDILYEIIGQGKAPFLKEIIEKMGLCGISHTKALTETVTCIPAIFTGRFEDASMSIKRFNNINITLDSVFNQSRHSWCFGQFLYSLNISQSLEYIPNNYNI